MTLTVTFWACIDKTSKLCKWEFCYIATCNHSWVQLTCSSSGSHCSSFVPTINIKFCCLITYRVDLWSYKCHKLEVHQIIHQRKVSNILIKIIQLYMNMERIFFYIHCKIFSFLNPTFLFHIVYGICYKYFP